MNNGNRSNNESLEHHLAKRYLMDSFVKGELKIKGLDLSKVKWDFVTVESVLDINGKSPYKEGLVCSGLKEDNFNRTKQKNYLHTHFETECEKYEVYYDDPVNFCHNKDKIKIKYLFDVGIFGEGRFKYALEVVKTSGVKQEKIDYCTNKGITVIEIKINQVINSFRYKHIREDELNLLKLKGHIINAKIHEAK